jgi:hypothetical protein
MCSAFILRAKTVILRAKTVQTPFSRTQTTLKFIFRIRFVIRAIVLRAKTAVWTCCAWTQTAIDSIFVRVILRVGAISAFCAWTRTQTTVDSIFVRFTALCVRAISAFWARTQTQSATAFTPAIHGIHTRVKTTSAALWVRTQTQTQTTIILVFSSDIIVTCADFPMLRIIVTITMVKCTRSTLVRSVTATLDDFMKAVIMLLTSVSTHVNFLDSFIDVMITLAATVSDEFTILITMAAPKYPPS